MRVLIYYFVIVSALIYNERLSGQILSVEETVFYINRVINEDLKNQTSYHPGKRKIILDIVEPHSISIKYQWDNNPEVLFQEFKGQNINYNHITFDVAEVAGIEKKDFKLNKNLILRCKNGRKNCVIMEQEALMWQYSSNFCDRPQARNAYEYVHLFYMIDEAKREKVYNALHYLFYELNRKIEGFQNKDPFLKEKSSVLKHKIPLEKHGGVFYLTLSLGGVLVDGVLDSGASEISIPKALEDYMLKNYIIDSSDYTTPGLYMIADGSISMKPRFTLPYVKIDDIEVRNVICSLNDSEDVILIGNSFLERFRSWEIDNTEQILKLNY